MSDSADDIVLESPPASDGAGESRRARLGYRYPLAHYCGPLKASERTLKLWISLGRGVTPPDLPPLDEPWRLAEWYARHRKNRVPDHLLWLAAQGSGAGDVAKAEGAGPLFEPAAACGIDTTSGGVPASQPSAGASLPPAGAKPALATGFSATLERLREAEAAAGKRYTDLILENKYDEAESAERRWQKLRGDLRDYERDAQKVLSAQGKLWPADEVAAVLYELHTVLLQSFESLYSRIETELRTLPREEAKRLYLAECRRLRAGLVANKFTAPPAPEQLAA